MEPRPNGHPGRLACTLIAGVMCATVLQTAGSARAAEPGTLDPSFGNGGVAAPLFAESNGFGTTGVALQGDKVVVAGWTSPGHIQDFAVARFTSSGQPDTTFGGDGAVTTNLGGSEGAQAVLTQPDGKIVAVGGREPFTSSGRGFHFVRYLGNGSLDPGFSGDGKLIVPGPLFGPALDRAYAAALQPDGKIVAAGWATSGGGDLAVVRLTTTGALDRTFSGDGIAVLNRGGFEGAHAVGLQPDGKIVVAGTHSPGSGGFHALLARFTATGALDSTFGTGGSTTTPLNASFRPVSDLVVQPDGKIAVAGETHDGTDSEFAVARYTASGLLDPSFSQDGIAVTNLMGGGRASGLALQSDGRLVAAGQTYNGGYVVLARYLVDGTPDSSFGPAGLRHVWQVLSGGSHDAVLQPDGKLVVSCCSAAARFLMTSTVVTGPTCDGLTATIVGTAGNDSLTGTAGPDVVAAGAGNDTVTGLGGDDRICGGDGVDTAAGGAGDDRIFGEGGNDQLYGSAGADRVDGGDGVDLVDFSFATGPVVADLAAGIATGEGSDVLSGIEWAAGGAHADDLRGDSAVNRLFGRGGNDVLDGREGDDTLAGSAGNDQLVGGSGSDVLNMAGATGPVTVDLSAGTAQGEGTDSVTGTEHVIGSSFADVLLGDAVGNVLNAGAGNDRVVGAGGNDSLYGGDGADDLGGGAGTDLCDGGTNPSGTADTADSTCEVRQGIP